MARLDAGVDDRDHDTGPVEPASPCLVRADQRHALRQRRSLDLVDHDAFDPEWRRLELGDGISADGQSEERHGLVLVNDLMCSPREPGQHLRTDARDVTPLPVHGGGRQ